jgi:mono/diheme cytochrome c family protein
VNFALPTFIFDCAADKLAKEFGHGLLQLEEFMKLKALTLGTMAIGVVALVSACGDDSSSSAADGADYTATGKALLTSNCTGCHGGTTSPNLSTFSGVKSNRTAMLNRINANTMPPSQSDAWKNTDKAKLVEYLTNSADFK